MIEYLGLFFSAFVAGSFFPLGSEPGAIYLYTKGFSPVLLITFASIGNTLGGMTCYILCRLGKSKVLKFNEAKLNHWINRIKDKAEPYALLCWLPFVGELIAGALGFVSIKWKRIFIFMFLGKAFRYIAIIVFYDVVKDIS